jgi:hypothetical protein
MAAVASFSFTESALEVGISMSREPIPQARVYRHIQCNAETVISGNAFEVASNPLGDMLGTYCSECEAQFPMSDYVWADTNEPIVDYYARHAAKATARDRFLCSRRFSIGVLAVGALLGAVAGFLLFLGSGTMVKLFMTAFTGYVGAVVLGTLHMKVVEKSILRRVCGVSDTRLLK